MKRRLPLLFAATSLFAPFSFNERVLSLDVAQNSNAVQRSESKDAISRPNVANNVESYLGADVRWIVDRRHGVISAWSLEEARPLWSRDGVVFRLAKRPNALFNDFPKETTPPPKKATEIFGRVYFFLDDLSQRRKNSEPFAQDARLLVALDPRAQGRLVWKRRAQDFARFFSPNDPNVLRFEPKLEASADDKLLIQVQSPNEVKRFKLDAATGSLSLTDDAVD